MFELSTPTPRPDYVAAVDLGSNSFHLIIARWDNGQMTLLDRLKEPVRLGFGLTEDGELTDDARQRALECLSRFGERLRGYPSRDVRIVGTKTLRSLVNADAFLAEAEARLGHPVDIISGDEEARLVYLGVAHNIGPRQGKRIVVDIGGGSTEIILGQGMTPLKKESVNLGCVAITRRFFPNTHVNAAMIEQALTRCLQTLSAIQDEFDLATVEDIFGTSGTIKAAAKVCTATGSADGVITLSALENLLQHYAKEGSIEASLPGLSEDRKPVFLGGIIVLAALFKTFSIPSMQVADWALREGVLFDHNGRLQNDDIRRVSVLALATRFRVNREKAAWVEATALRFLSQVAEPWQLTGPDAGMLLGFAAQLCTLGLDIAHQDYHKHSAYIVEHTDIAGFTTREQTALAVLVLAHRKRLPDPLLKADKALLRMALLLRLAVIFHRGRRADIADDVQVRVDTQALYLTLPDGFRQAHPLTVVDLANEQHLVKAAGYTLSIAE